MTVTITVTEEHVKNGRRQDCTDCAFALAVNEVLRKPYDVHIFGTLRILDDFGKPVAWIKLDRLVRDAINALDIGLNAPIPFSFRDTAASVVTLNPPKEKA
jgi:hypothetical protein